MNSPRVSHRFNRLLRAALFLAVGLAASAAQAGIKSERLLATILKNTPSSTLVTAGQQMEHAERAAAEIPGAQVLWGVGKSMEPLYSSKTAVVVAPRS